MGSTWDIHIYIHTYIHTYIYTYIHGYIHTYIHTYILVLPRIGFFCDRTNTNIKIRIFASSNIRRKTKQNIYIFDRIRIFGTNSRASSNILVLIFLIFERIQKKKKKKKKKKKNPRGDPPRF